MKKISTLFCLCFASFCFSQNSSYHEFSERRNPEEIKRFIKENPNHPDNKKLRYLLIKIRLEEKENRKKEKKTYSIKDFRKKIAEQRAEYKTGNNVLGTVKPSYHTDYNTDNTYAYSDDNSSSIFPTTSSSNSNDKDVEILNHLFSTSKNKKKAYIEVKNLSKCLINLEIKGRQKFLLKIPSHEEGRILVPKGSYVFSGKICSKKYTQSKELNSDVVVTLE